MKVSKRQVEEVVFDLDGQTVVLSSSDANALWRLLTQILDKPLVIDQGCDNRYSHAAHFWKSGKANYRCSGRSFDAT